MRRTARGGGGKASVRASLPVFFAVVSVLAALGVITSPWHSSPPLSGSSFLWLTHVPPLLFGGAITVAYRLSLSSDWVPALLSCAYALPFFGTLCLHVGAARRMRVVGPVAGAWFLSVSVFDLVASRLPSSAGMGSAREISAVLGAVGLGILLLVMSYLGVRDSTGGAPMVRALALVLGVAGIGILTYVLLPVGLFMLLGGYVLLALCYVRELTHGVSK